MRPRPYVRPHCDLDAVAFLTKPFSAHELIEPLKKASGG
jgi:FixJ family two-component response regulator